MPEGLSTFLTIVTIILSGGVIYVAINLPKYKDDPAPLSKKIWHVWKGYGQFLGNLLARVVLTIFYFTIMLPFSLGSTLFGDLLKIKGNRTKYWIPREEHALTTINDASRQF
ncbi:MAG: hypothetical protein B6242_02515 [Anaerolineaceae bacterium 4572_78]|nr:MAG: hypothetical protein B6242_02515 [Anaerolineaceae bacterium 4572_78]